MRTSVCEPEETSEQTDWTLALAGGEGIRLVDYVTKRFGTAIPKQYCQLLGKRTLVQHTLERLNKIIPASRTLTVIGARHAAVAVPQLRGRSDHVFSQPASRDTGMAVYVGLAMIKRWAPRALVTITPTDHYTSPSKTYVEHVQAARQVAARMPDHVVILGASPTEPDPDLGYLMLGSLASEVPRIHHVARFVEKPPLAAASELCDGGALWNTMVTCGTVDALWELGRATEPQLIDILDSLVPLIGTDVEDEAIDYVYRALLPINFSTDVLERSTDRLLALQLENVAWSDWGHPSRIETTLAVHRSTRT